MSNKKQLEKMLRLSNIKKKPLNESLTTSAIEFIKSVSDGNTYAIVRENRTYYIKSTETKDTLLESDFDYLGGLGNRTKNSFRGYDDAVTRLNLMFNDINRVQGINEDVDMVNFSHVLNENGEYVKAEPLQEKKFILKQPKVKAKAPEPEMDFGGEDTEGGDEFDFGSEEGEEGGDEFDFGSEEGEEGGEPEMEFDSTEEEGGDSIKDIQKTTGKLGQQLRDTEDLSSDMQKWVAKSVISALNLGTMDDADRDNIISTLENGGKEEDSNQEVDFMDDDMEYGDVEYKGGRIFDDSNRAGEPELDSGEEILLDDDEDEGPGGYLGWEDDVKDSEALEMRDIDMGIQDKGYLNLNHEIDYMDDEIDIDGPMVYMTDDDMELCEDGGCGEEVEEGMSKWSEADNESGMGWETNEATSYMDDEYSDEDVTRMFDNTDISDDIYGMNKPAPAEPTVKPGTDAPTRPSKNPFTPPSRIKPGEEPRPKAETDYMAEPSPSQDPNEAPTIAPSEPGTDRPSRPSKNPFTPPSRIKPGEEPRPKADVDYMDDEDVEFS
jgi:hypothetical protein